MLVPLSASLAVVLFVAGCHTCNDRPTFREGTRFVFTVLEDASPCGEYLTLAAGETFELSAAETLTDGQGCAFTPAAGPPEFEHSRLVFSRCDSGAEGSLVVRCVAAVPGCEGAGSIIMAPGDVPEGREAVETEMFFTAGIFCAGTGCSAHVPVRIQRL